MATKKQKRAAALAKREKFLADVKEQGLRAQEWDHEQQKARRVIIADVHAEIAQHHADVFQKAQQHSQLMMEPTMEDIDKLSVALYIGLGD